MWAARGADATCMLLHHCEGDRLRVLTGAGAVMSPALCLLGGTLTPTLCLALCQVRIYLDDQIDAKSLMGAYMCTSVPGEFAWQPGPLTQVRSTHHLHGMLLEVTCTRKGQPSGRRFG